jgi:hypothetical protein
VSYYVVLRRTISHVLKSRGGLVRATIIAISRTSPGAVGRNLESRLLIVLIRLSPPMSIMMLQRVTRVIGA